MIGELLILSLVSGYCRMTTSSKSSTVNEVYNLIFISSTFPSRLEALQRRIFFKWVDMGFQEDVSFGLSLKPC